MKVLSKPGDVVRLRDFVVAHILDDHAVCDERCVDVPDGALVIALTEPFHVKLDLDADYWEFVALGPTGVACFWCGDGEVLV